MSNWNAAKILGGLILIVGFAISSIVIHAKGTAFPDKGDCALPFEVANLTKASLDKSLMSQWRWTYEDENQDLKIRATCPSHYQDADVFYNDKLIARTKGKIFNFEGSFDLLDCNGKKFGRWSAGSWGNRIQNKWAFEVNSYIEKDGEIIGWIQGENFVSENIGIVSAQSGELVATMKRDKISLSWSWEIVRHQPLHPAADWRFLLGIIGKESFGEDEDDSCMCNQYFYGLLYALIGVVSLIFCMAGCVCCTFGPRVACNTCLLMFPCCDNIKCSCLDKDTSTSNGSENYEDYRIDMIDMSQTSIEMNGTDTTNTNDNNGTITNV